MTALLWCPRRLWMSQGDKAPGECHPSVPGVKVAGGLKWLREASGSFSAHMWGAGPPRGWVIDPFTSHLTVQHRFWEGEPRGPPCRASASRSSPPSPTEAWRYTAPLLCTLLQHPSTGHSDLRRGKEAPSLERGGLEDCVGRRGRCGCLWKIYLSHDAKHTGVSKATLQNSLIRMLY